MYVTMVICRHGKGPAGRQGTGDKPMKWGIDRTEIGWRQIQEDRLWEDKSNRQNCFVITCKCGNTTG
jgi:hypothetical protein